MLHSGSYKQASGRYRFTLAQKLIILNSILVVSSLLLFAGVQINRLQALLADIPTSDPLWSSLLAYKEQTTSSLLILGILLCCSLAFIALHQYQLPLRRITRYTQKLTSGHLTSQPPSCPSGEFEAICHAFQALGERLDQGRKQLAEWNYHAEKLVNERYRQLKQRHMQLVHKEKSAALEIFAVGIINRLASPLTTLQGVSTQLKQSAPSPAEWEAIDDVTRQCTAVLKDLKTFYQPDPPHKAPCNINQILLESLKAADIEALSSNVVVMRQLGSSLMRVNGTPSQIQRALINIITNACQAMQHLKRGSLQLSTRTEETPEPVVTIVIKDTGHGIPEKYTGKLFDPFFTTRPDTKAVGLGLSVAYGIIKAHGGTIAIESTEGSGTTCTVCLPAVPDVLPSKLQAPAPASLPDTLLESFSSQPPTLSTA